MEKECKCKRSCNSDAKRIVVTGMGVCSPLGQSADFFWNQLLEGKSAIVDITSMYPFLSDYKVKVGGMFNQEKYNLVENYLERNVPAEKKEFRRLTKVVKYGLVAADQAISDSGIMEFVGKDRIGVSVGSGIGGLSTIEEQSERANEKGLDKVSPLLIPQAITDSVSGMISIIYKFHATECPSVVSACATGASCIKYGLMSILAGDADVMVCGGSEAAATKLGFGGFGNMHALSTNSNPLIASRPFDKERDGFVMGEGAGVVVLESLEHALNRNARIYAELLSYGTSADGYHLTMPDENGEYAARAMAQSIERAGLTPSDIGYINAHGTSTPFNDKIETLAIKKVFGEDGARKVSISSTKSMTGHCLGAGASIEAIITILALRTGQIPPTINLHSKDPECDLDYTPHIKLERSLDYALSNSFGFFGHNVTLVFGKYKP